MAGYNPCMEVSAYSSQQPPAVSPIYQPPANVSPIYQPPANQGPNYQPPMPAPAPMPLPTPMPGGETGGMPGVGGCPSGSVPYMVQEGDTLYNIARLYNTTVANIMAANPSVSDMNMLYIGQVICVPAAMPTPMPCNGQPYTVQPGDTFYSLARKFGVTVADLMAANPGVPASNLIAGYAVCIPAPTVRPCPTGSMTYTVVQGDTLSSIADRFSVSVYSLTVANPGFSPDNLMAGTRLCIAPFACTPSCVESERYTLAQGEDLAAVATKFSVTTDDILKANPFSPPCYFVAGNSICLPANAVSPVTPSRRR
jgi:peptidoglycan endopeptidase LytF